MADNILTKKYGPLPGWAWGLVGVGGFLVVRYLRARSAAAASSSTTASPVTGGTTAGGYAMPQEPTASLTTPSGFQYSGPLSGLQSVIPQGALAATASSSAPPQTQPTGPQYTSLNPVQASALANAGVPEFFQLGGMLGPSFPYYPYVPGGQPNATFASGQPQGGYALYTQNTAAPAAA